MDFPFCRKILSVFTSIIYICIYFWYFWLQLFFLFCNIEQMYVCQYHVYIVLHEKISKYAYIAFKKSSICYFSSISFGQSSSPFLRYFRAFSLSLCSLDSLVVYVSSKYRICSYTIITLSFTFAFFLSIKNILNISSVQLSFGH